MDPVMQVLDPTIKVCLVVLPRQSIDARRGIPLQRVEGRAQHGHTDVVEKRGEPFLLPLPCSLPYAAQRL
jgi:hypothetical protein